MDINKLVRENVKSMSSYSTARDESGAISGIFLDANESPFNTGYNRYPDPQQKKLKSVVSKIKNVPVESVFAGNGSDEAIDLLIRIFCVPGRDNIISVKPTYGMYKVAAAVNDIEYREIPLNEDFSLDSGKLLSAADSNSKLVFLCSPNNPTGNLLNKEAVLSVIKNFKGIVIVDEAYIDYSEDCGFVSQIKDFQNLVVLQTLSKAWGLAALRVGFAFSSKEIISYMDKIKYPYNINSFSQEFALKAIANGNNEHTAAVIEERKRVSHLISSLVGVKKVYSSSANFLLVKFADSSKIFNDLKNKKIVVRDRASQYGCSDTLRITIGKKSENDFLLAILSGESNGLVLPLIEVKRDTKETNVLVKIDLLGNMTSSISTGIRFFDHMLEQIAVHSGFTMDIDVLGDIDVDVHHTIEDTAIALGQALKEAFSNGRTNNRYGFALPMDESKAEVLIDAGGRSFLMWDVEFSAPYVGGIESDMFRHFFDTLSRSMFATIHISAKGKNDHHLIESIFKCFSRALKGALNYYPDDFRIQSSKGLI